MSVSTLALTGGWRDNYGLWASQVVPWLEPLELSECHMPRYVVMPSVQDMVIPSSGKILYNFHLPPGSIIWGIAPQASSTATTQALINEEVAIQLTDLVLQHRFFQEPIKPVDLASTGQEFDRYQGYTLFAAPHPVVGDGLMSFEAWGPVGAYYWAVLLISEASNCNNLTK